MPTGYTSARSAELTQTLHQLSPAADVGILQLHHYYI